MKFKRSIPQPHRDSANGLNDAPIRRVARSIRMNLRLLAIIVAAGVSIWFSRIGEFEATAQDGVASKSVRLDIGSKAPAISIEHYIQDGNGRFDPVTKFEDDKIYVIEFWATWCGPCISSMPEIADLQSRYRDKGLRIISITDETVDEVNQLLQRKHPAVDRTIAEITSLYTLTADPDRSVHEDYFDAAGETGIPSAFIVGKTGVIEWIGHPFEMKPVIEALLDDSWDRDGFARQRATLRRLAEVAARVDRMVSSGETDQAIELVTKLLDDEEDPQIRRAWENTLNNVKISTGRLDDDAIKYYVDNLELMKDDVVQLARFSFDLYGLYQQGVDVTPLPDRTLSVMKKTEPKIDATQAGLFYHTMALMHQISGNIDAAIAAQTKSVKSSNGAQKEQLSEALEAMKEIRQKQAKPDDSP